MATLKYQITFFDYWHTGSGLSGGAAFDSSVVKDENNLPFVAGKTIKGLAREMAEQFNNEIFIKHCFGEEGINQGICYFSNAIIDKTTKNEIISNKLQDNLYTIIAATQIDKNGIAVDNSLREIEVVLPITLEGEILEIDDAYIEPMKQALQLIKRLGLNRNRGLGRCEIKVKES